jgi:hypothetical protein
MDGKARSNFGEPKGAPTREAVNSLRVIENVYWLTGIA